MTPPDWADEVALDLDPETSPTTMYSIASALRAAFLRGRVAGLREAVEIADGKKIEGGTNDAIWNPACHICAKAIRAAADKLEREP